MHGQPEYKMPLAANCRQKHKNTKLQQQCAKTSNTTECSVASTLPDDN